jgi:FMN reductase
MRPFIVGIGGTQRPGSSTERALRFCLRTASRFGADVTALVGEELALPMYNPEQSHRSVAAQRLIELLKRSDGIIIASPGYHGTISAFVKNALDYTEDLVDDGRPYFEGRAVGCIVSASGWMATGTTLVTLRSIVHALRGWPTPSGALINSRQTSFTADDQCTDENVCRQLETVAEQVVSFARMRMRSADNAAQTGIRHNPAA